LFFIDGKLEHKVFWKAFRVSLNLLIRSGDILLNFSRFSQDNSDLLTDLLTDLLIDLLIDLLTDLLILLLTDFYFFIFKITPKGLKLLAIDPDKIDISMLAQYPEFVEFIESQKR
jgi:hypothetical protein